MGREGREAKERRREKRRRERKGERGERIASGVCSFSTVYPVLFLCLLFGDQAFVEKDFPKCEEILG